MLLNVCWSCSFPKFNQFIFIIKKIVLTFILFSFSSFVVSQNFNFIEPNVLELKEKISKVKNTEPIFNYLKNNYSITSEKFEKQFFEWETSEECAFKQKFNNNIIYSTFDCKEASGTSIELEIPKIKRSDLMTWIEKIYEIEKMANNENVWKENNSKFEPKEAVPGCYFKIEEKIETTFITLYCGC
jgi:hypothetical protein